MYKRWPENSSLLGSSQYGNKLMVSAASAGASLNIQCLGIRYGAVALV